MEGKIYIDHTDDQIVRVYSVERMPDHEERVHYEYLDNKGGSNYLDMITFRRWYKPMHTLAQLYYTTHERIVSV